MNKQIDQQDLVGVTNLDKNIYRLIEDQVSLFPEKTALRCGNETVTYLELNERANQLAHHLQLLDVKPEIMVGVFTTRSIEMVVGILGVLKAGGAYVPLDPSYPQERLAFIFEDAQINVVVTQSHLLSALPVQGVQLICLDKDWAEIAAQPDENLESFAISENLAYVIYTSGSTGKPKGVMITHANLSSFVKLASAALDVMASDIYLQSASIAYALSVRQLMIPLAYGAEIVVATGEQARDPFMLFELIKIQNVTLMDMVPSFWRTCIQRLLALSPAERDYLLDNRLRRIVSIGEPLTADIPFDWSHKLGHSADLVNIFGQTETTGIVAIYPIPFNTHIQTGIVPIGKGIPDTHLFILDNNLRPISQGDVGELCISNPCVARGYLNRPDLTAEKFVPNLFDDKQHDRFYRTGDMARCREDGNIEFLGRGDYQVKIRGQRLELGEVESVLRQHSAVSECVAVVRGDEIEDKYLVAYIVLLLNEIAAADELRNFMKQQVPEYMIPSTFVFLDALPLTPNGKINRLALPDPATTVTTNKNPDTHTEPRNHIERVIAAIWKNLLKLNQLSIHDDFFELGGHSLMSVRMFTHIERDLGVRLPYTSLFHATTIAQLAALVANINEDVTKWKIVVPVRTHGANPPFFGVHAHEGGVLFWRDIVSHLPEDQPFYALQAIGVDGLQTPLNHIPEMAKLYIRELRKVQPQGPFYIGGYSMGGEIAFEMAQQLVSQGEKVALLVMLDTRNPIRPIRIVSRDAAGLLTPESALVHPTVGSEILKQKLRGHLLRLTKLNPLLIPSYLWNQAAVRIARLTIFTLANIFKKMGRRIPDRVLLPYLRLQHSIALTNYMPTAYPGKITLFRATQTLLQDPDDSPMGWKPLALGGMDVFHFKAPHEIISPKYAKEVAGQLYECMKKARDE